MARYDIVSRAEIAREVIFSGTPSQVVNLPTFIKWLVVAALIVAGYVFALTRWPVPWFAPALALLLVALGVLLAYLQTAFTEIIIDTERITCRQGILNRRVSSIELFRIQDVTSVHPWWQRLFGIGAVVVMTSDSNNPVWRMPGMQHAEQLRDELNRAAIALRDVKGVREVNMGRV
ncbi:putative membrane protein YdbT with pleckstrin-like domain [Paraburkholderia terricola]|uniref:PH domain-containing protein n=1 Tax=Paraburkholderia terricola TaxID=169427 RepID=UPI002865AB32|nr:PH domain-containing protein [Paraburkholderia terricola]MDR6449644.1 putative membrane protein YdbT with pleckstrin-like domain [Paraburkholderia terricola]